MVWIMVPILWTACCVAQIAVLVRICCARRLIVRWWPVALWMVVDLAASLRLTVSDYDRHSWEWAVQWATWIWPVLAVQVLAAGGVVLNIIRQYGRANRRFLAAATAILSLIAFGVSAALATIIEAHAIPPDPTRVEIALAGQRVIALALAALMLAAIAMLAARPLLVSPNLRAIPGALAVYWIGATLRACVSLAAENWIGRTITVLDATALPMALSAVVFAALAWSIRPAREWDTPPLTPEQMEAEAALDRSAAEYLRAALAALRSVLQGNGAPAL